MPGKMTELLHQVQEALCVFLQRFLPSWRESTIEKTKNMAKVRGSSQPDLLETLEKVLNLPQCDLKLLLKIFDVNWDELCKKMRLSFEDRNHLKETQAVRNRWAHLPTAGPSKQDYCRDLDTIRRFLQVIKADEKLIQDVESELECATLDLDFVKRQRESAVKAAAQNAREDLAGVTEQRDEYEAKDVEELEEEIEELEIEFHFAHERKIEEIADAYESTGETLLDEGDYDGAINNLDKALNSQHIRGQETLGTLHFWRSLAYREKGAMDQSESDFKKSVELCPNSPRNVLLNRALRRQDKEDLDGAIADMGYLIDLEKNLPRDDRYMWLWYQFRCWFHDRKGNIEGVIADATRMIEISPNRARSCMSYIERGSAYLSCGNIEQAVRDFEKAMEIKPGYAEAYNCRGKAYHDKGDYGRAIADFTRAIEIKPDYAEAYNDRGLSKKDSADLIGAEKDIQKAVELRPKEKYFQANLAAVRRLLSREQGTDPV